jgi:RNA polymerase II subunit A C-terminal domain phosphatase
MYPALVDDFFVGIGDINSAFLPKVNPLTPSVPSQPPSPPANPVTSIPPSSSPTPLTPAPTSPPEVPSGVAIQEAPQTLEESDDEELEKRTMLTRNSIALEAQVEERPLAKKQEELDEQEQKEEDQDQICDAIKPDGKGSEVVEVKTDTQSTPHKHPVKALLRNDDYELLRVKSVRYFRPLNSFVLTCCLEFQLLDQVHREFYDAYDVSQTLKRPSSPVTKKGKRRPTIVDEDAPPYDVKVKHLIYV